MMPPRASARRKGVAPLFARRATLSRSLRLLSQFRYEQPDPARFYRAVAEDTATMVTDLWRDVTGTAPTGRTLLDVGGGPGYFAAAFTDAGLHYIGVEPDPREIHVMHIGAVGAATSGAAPAGGTSPPKGRGTVRGTTTYVRASGVALPFADASVDICLSSNVAEHVPQPWRLGS